MSTEMSSSRKQRELLKTIYLQYREQLVQWLIKYFSLPLEEATELCQEAFAIFLEKMLQENLPEFETNSNLKSYLFAIAKNKAYERSRRSNKHVPLTTSLDPSDSGQELEEKLQQETLIDKATAAFKLLGAKCQQLLHMAIVLKSSMQDIAIQLQYENAATAKNMKYKCLIQLRKHYRQI